MYQSFVNIQSEKSGFYKVGYWTKLVWLGLNKWNVALSSKQAILPQQVRWRYNQAWGRLCVPHRTELRYLLNSVKQSGRNLGESLVLRDITKHEVTHLTKPVCLPTRHSYLKKKRKIITTRINKMNSYIQITFSNYSLCTLQNYIYSGWLSIYCSDGWLQHLILMMHPPENKQYLDSKCHQLL